MKTFCNSAYSSLLKPGKKPAETRKLYVRSVGYCSADSNFYEKPRRMNFGGFRWCVKGQGILTVDKRKYTLQPGEVLFFPPGSQVDCRPLDGEMFFYWLAFDGDILMPLLDSLNIKPGKKFCGHPPDELLQQLISEIRNTSPDRRLNALQIAMQILFAIALPDENITASEPKTLAQTARSIIEKEFTLPEFTIYRLCTRLGVHSVTLCRAFKKEFQITPSEFLIGCRLQKAAELLASRKYLVKNVSAMCGFTSPEYFSTAFAGRFGIAPSRILNDPDLELPEFRQLTGIL